MPIIATHHISSDNIVGSIQSLLFLRLCFSWFHKLSRKKISVDTLIRYSKTIANLANLRLFKLRFAFQLSVKTCLAYIQHIGKLWLRDLLLTQPTEKLGIVVNIVHSFHLLKIIKMTAISPIITAISSNNDTFSINSTSLYIDNESKIIYDNHTGAFAPALIPITVCWLFQQPLR